MRTREEQIRPWGYISPFATKTLKDRARCDLTITRKQTHNITMPLYTEDQLLEAERRAEQRLRAEIGRDSEWLDWLAGAVQEVSRVSNRPTRWILEFRTSLDSLDRDTLRQAIDAAQETE